MNYPTLAVGASGQAVAALQRALQQAGYQLTVDGAFGPQTKTAVQSLQRAGRITADGIVGPETWTALENMLGMSLNIPPTVQHTARATQSSEENQSPRRSGGGGIGTVVAVLGVLAVMGVVIGRALIGDAPEPQRKQRGK